MSNPTGLCCLGSYVHVLLMYLLHVLVAGCHVGGYFCPPFQSVVDSSLFNASYSHTRLVELGPWKDRRTEGVPYVSLIPKALASYPGSNLVPRLHKTRENDSYSERAELSLVSMDLATTMMSSSSRQMFLTNC